MSNTEKQNEQVAIKVLPDRSLPALRLAGLSIRTHNAEGERTIPALWERVRARRWEGTPGATAWEGPEVPMVGLYSEYESGQDGPFTVTAGIPLAAEAAAPADLVLREVPARTYAHVQATGSLLPAVMAAWEHVWRELTPRRSFLGDLEVFRWSPGRPLVIDLFVSVSAPASVPTR